MAEAIGAAAVVASLIYLALQIRSGAKAFKTEYRDAAMRSLMEWSHHVMGDKDLPWIFQRGCHDFQSLDERDRARLVHTMYSFFKVYENLYLHYLDGVIGCELWEANSSVLATYSTQPGAQYFLSLRQKAYDPGFLEMLKTLDGSTMAPGHLVSRLADTEEAGAEASAPADVLRSAPPPPVPNSSP
ncbi:hypothetical protein [Brevundimonas sp.]|uniref:hypothetical protein n=1 Tax=Brevundimonas sp. TaxID=1871086 RepID=UPI0027300958|nr:hypothetical protein [Brevundimonas sp.]MDP1912701.1 hypothetical protein [Brevundimonas sp.]